MPFNGVPLPGLKDARLREALTQEQLAERAGISRATVARLEMGGPAGPRTVRKLADALDLEPVDLMEPEAPRARVAERRATYRTRRGGSGKAAEAA